MALLLAFMALLLVGVALIAHFHAERVPLYRGFQVLPWLEAPAWIVFDENGKVVSYNDDASELAAIVWWHDLELGQCVRRLALAVERNDLPHFFAHYQLAAKGDEVAVELQRRSYRFVPISDPVDGLTRIMLLVDELPTAAGTS